MKQLTEAEFIEMNNKDKTRYILGIQEAYLDGKEIEFINADMYDLVWKDAPNPSWYWGSYFFRVKPKQESNEEDFDRIKGELENIINDIHCLYNSIS